MLQDKLAYTDDLEQVHKAERIVLMTPSNDSNRTYVPEFQRGRGTSEIDQILVKNERTSQQQHLERSSQLVKGLVCYVLPGEFDA